MPENKRRQRLAPASRREQGRLPTWFILGAMRCGTGAVHRALGSHPGIHASDRKEIRFFDVRYGNGEAWYRRHFPTDTQARALEEQTGHPLPIGESTPAYVFHPAVPARLRRMVPGARLVVLVREPVARAVSHYHLAVRKRWEDLELRGGDRARAGASRRRRGAAARRPGVPQRGAPAPELRLPWPVRTAARALAGAVSRGADPGQKSEDLYAEPDRVLGEICEFIGAPPLPAVQLGWVTRSPKTSVPDDARTLLAERFAEPNARLYELLGRDLGW